MIERIEAPKKTDVDKLVDRFCEWAEDVIVGRATVPPLSEQHRLTTNEKIDTLLTAKRKIKELAKEVQGGNN